ncbi:hypothetical protein [Streptomyces sp. JJ36]|uniref:hypothetical protein n=1 Tax=Streptomyces sp. JJ36 TaxID=2736645 RepID=UPI001F2BAFAB|nr:hypothetical protein [Streptomyces sp. JJ36]MCF6523659.1 hypothetical protein [Streptomyces sp. JJ36]
MSLNVVHVICPQPPGHVGGSDLHVAELAAHQARTGLRPLVVQGRSPEYAERLRSRDPECGGPEPVDGYLS